MLYETCSSDDCLTETFHAAVQEHQNVVLQAGSFQNHTLDFAQSVCQGLRAHPRQLECRFLYDARGSELYEEICRQPEYYPTRTEADILHQYAGEISRTTGPCHLLELGSGSSVKTDYLLSAYQDNYESVCYTPIDISASALRLAGNAIIDKRPAVQVVGIHGTYTDSFQLLSCASPALVVFLGSTIGNFNHEEEREFWQEIMKNMKVGDYFLLGVDLLKEREILNAAYNDAAGVTASFTKNYFARMNRELNSSLDLNHMKHVAFFNQDESQMEIYVEFTRPQTIQVGPLQESFSVEKGERIQIEISRKFHLQGVSDFLKSFGLKTVKTFTDKQEWFGLLLLKKV